MNYIGTNHIVVINWSKKAMAKVEQLITLNNYQHIVIIDTLNQTPINHPQVHYIKGKPSDTNVLLKANILKAAMVYISVPDLVKDDMLIDGKTILIAKAIQSLSNKFISKMPYMIAEIKSKRHILLFQNIKIDEYIILNENFNSFMTSTVRRANQYPLLITLLQKRYSVLISLGLFIAVVRVFFNSHYSATGIMLVSEYLMIAGFVLQTALLTIGLAFFIHERYYKKFNFL